MVYTESGFGMPEGSGSCRIITYLQNKYYEKKGEILVAQPIKYQIGET